MNKKAFYLTDTLIALFVSLLAMTGVGATQKAAATAMESARTARTSAHILGYARSLTPAHLETSNERHFDFLGQPCQAPGSFCLRVTTTPEPGQIIYTATLTWRDHMGTEQRLSFERKEWRPL